MNVGDIIEVEIVSNGMDGEGIARVDGKVVFLPYSLKGERVRAVIKQVKSKYINASVIKVLQPSVYRTTPECPHYYHCGGCDMGHIAPEYRRELLLNELKNNLKKIAGIDYSPAEFVPCKGGAAHRNKLSMPFGISGGKIVLGLYRQNTHVVQPVMCGMSGSLSQNIAKTVCSFANKSGLSVYDDGSGKGLLRHLVVREVGDRASATLVINGEKFAGEKQLAALLPNNVDFFICKNTKRGNAIMGDSVRLVKGSPRLSVNVLGVCAELSPLSFLQVNDFMRDELYKSAVAAISSRVLVDLYSGIGITSNLAAAVCDKVFAVEIVPQAVSDADRTAELNGNAHKINNICGDAEKIISSVVEQVSDFDVLIDPPRKGCGAGVAKAIAACRPNTLIYISCNHATMCRDIRAFLDVSPDYDLTECKVFDMFPNTHHTETLVCLKRKQYT